MEVSVEEYAKFVQTNDEGEEKITFSWVSKFFNNSNYYGKLVLDKNIVIDLKHENGLSCSDYEKNCQVEDFRGNTESLKKFLRSTCHIAEDCFMREGANKDNCYYFIRNDNFNSYEEGDTKIAVKFVSLLYRLNYYNSFCCFFKIENNKYFYIVLYRRRKTMHSRRQAAKLQRYSLFGYRRVSSHRSKARLAFLLL